MDWSWTPSGSPVLNNLQSFNWAYGGTNNAYQQNIWDVYNYGQTLADGRTLYAVVNTNWNGPEALVVLESGTINNNPVFVEATDTKYSGSFREPSR